MNFVPVKSKDGERLMPTTTTRAAMQQNFRYKSVPEQPKVKQEVFAIQLTFL